MNISWEKNGKKYCSYLWSKIDIEHPSIIMEKFETCFFLYVLLQNPEATVEKGTKHWKLNRPQCKKHTNHNI